ncbi:MAG: hypothetical protein K2H38_10345, partial [Muribaculaceae bacterium]|nr:hypothetical protein [Muribaculaceae bacterium]
MKTITLTSYMIFGSMVLLSSCAQEDNPSMLPDRDDRRIVFHTTLPELTTKAKEITTELPYFHLTAFDE